MFSDAKKDNEPCNAAPTAAELVARHQAGVWRYLRVLGCDNSTADDLTQETFLAVLKRDQLVHLSDAATAAYLRRTAKNLYISLQRRSGRVHSVADTRILDQVWSRWAGADLDSDDLIAVLRKCFEQLTPRAQRSLYLRYHTKKSRTEIGEELGITEHGAKNLMQRAKGQLRQCVEKKTG